MIEALRKMASWASDPFGKKLSRARGYVGTIEISGEVQLEILRREGCLPSSKVLEIGCGCLNAGLKIIDYLDKGNYCGIDPNTWLREAALKDHRNRRLITDKQASFVSRDDFDGSCFGMTFDFIFSHSILSHAAHWQLDQFLKNTTKLLAPNGKIVSSIRLAEGNNFGSPGTSDKQDSMDEEWQYPGVSWFKFSTVEAAADKFNMSVVVKPEYTEYYTSHRPVEIHDWLVFSWKNNGRQQG